MIDVFNYSDVFVRSRKMGKMFEKKIDEKEKDRQKDTYVSM